MKKNCNISSVMSDILIKVCHCPLISLDQLILLIPTIEGRKEGEGLHQLKNPLVGHINASQPLKYDSADLQLHLDIPLTRSSPNQSLIDTNLH